MDVGHVAVFRSLIRGAEIGHELEVDLFEALQKKDVPALRNLTKRVDAKTRAALLLLPELYGGADVLDLAEKKLPQLPELKKALATLRALSKASPIPVSFDLAELRGYHYHSGVVFDAYCDGVSGAVARGGRYDEVGRAFGRPRAATGFSIELRDLASAMKVNKKKK
jgi:ATP phosphoribosyltransferase regulatory subunit